MAPAVFDEVGVSPSVAGAAGPVFDEVLVDGAVFGETLGESLTAKCCCFHTMHLQRAESNLSTLPGSFLHAL